MQFVRTPKTRMGGFKKKGVSQKKKGGLQSGGLRDGGGIPRRGRKASAKDNPDLAGAKRGDSEKSPSPSPEKISLG